jgi:hypothetical protein
MRDNVGTAHLFVSGPGTGGPLLVNAFCDTSRAKYSGDGLSVSYQLVKLQLGDADLDPLDISGGVRVIPNWAVQGGGSGDREIPLTTVPPSVATGGPQVLTATFDMIVDAAHHQTTFSTTDRINVYLPPGLVPVGRVVAPALQVPTHEALRQCELIVHPADGKRWNLTHTRVRVQVANAPVDLAMNVELLLPGDQQGWRAGSFACKRGESTELFVEEDSVGLAKKGMRIRMHPDLKVAAEHGMTRVWGNDVVIDSVPIRFQTDAEFVALEAASKAKALP